MAAFALTEINLRYLKQTLRTELPNIKSSYLSEAIAVACGYRTHIALKTFLKAKSDDKIELVNACDDVFCKRLSELAGHEIYNEFLSKIIHSGNFPNPIWREFKGRDLDGINAWFRKCEKQQIPYIYITKRNKYAELNWDYISLDPKHDASFDGEDNGKTFSGRLYDDFCDIAPVSKKAVFQGTALVCHVDFLLPEEARKLADIYFTRIYSAITV